jgi:hypothetical protein
MTVPRFLALFLIGPIVALGILGNVAKCILYVIQGIRVGVRVPALLTRVTVQALLVLLFIWILKRIYFRSYEE